MDEPQKNELTKTSTADIMASRLDQLASEMNWGEIGTEETPARLRCTIENGKVVKILLEWPPGKVESFKAIIE